MKSIVGSIVDAVTRPSPVQFAPKAQQYSVPLGLGGARSTLLGAMGANGTLFSTVNRTSNATSQVNWRLWRKSRSGKKEDRVEVTSHLALDVWNSPNDFFPRQLFVESFQQHVDLVGEGWWVISHNQFGWPESMWVVRPDRITPVPSAERGVAGYVYTNPEGTQVPLETNEVIRLRMPNPADPGPAGRGMGAVQTILAQVEAVHYSAEWNRNFFLNSAVPGGIIEVPGTLNDTEFDRLRAQWSESHRGVSAAHRVGVLEGGAKWSETSLSQRDMQFVELLNVSRDVIREAFGMPKSLLGLVDDVNRASAEAMNVVFSSWLLVPRLERIKAALNTQLLPQFGPFGHGTGQPDVEFDYDNPVPPDAASESATLESRVRVFTQLVGSGVAPEDAATVAGLPNMNMAPERSNSARSGQAA